jgi:hypothetical protein
MTWTSKPKDLTTTDVVAHPHIDPNVVGRAPANATINFSPMELFGAAARCSYMTYVNPLISTQESVAVARMVEMHVDDTSADFAILASADDLKDYIKSYFSGLVGTGVAYLKMIDEKYVWSDHFENLGGGNASHKRKPDFVFGGQGTGVALMESKGSRSGSLSAFDTTVEDGYVGQVEPHLGYHVGGTMATHGYAIGAWMLSTTKAELRLHHTQVPAFGGSANPAGAPALNTIQRHNYATAFGLAHSPELGADLRQGQSRADQIAFFRTEWMGKRWLTNIGIGDLYGFEPFYWDHFWVTRRLGHGRHWFGSHFFAVEENIAIAALSTFLGGVRDGLPETLGIEPLNPEVRNAARAYRGDGDGGAGGGAVFPDGLALLNTDTLNLRFEPVIWDVPTGRLSD